MKEPQIKEDEVEVTLSYASRARYETLGYDFPSSFIVAKTKVKVKVDHLSKKSNVIVTRICQTCGKEDPLTCQKARHSPLCHKCATSSEAFSRNVSMTTQRARVSKGSRMNARRKYFNEIGKLPDTYVVHHINMDDQDNRLENFIALNRPQHHITHGSFNRLCKSLMEAGIVYFDSETLTYKLTGAIIK
jgi:hypothetical protein